MARTVVTFFFAGSGHSVSSKDDAVVDAFDACEGLTAFFAGPGGPGGEICVSDELFGGLSDADKERFHSTFTRENRDLFGTGQKVGVGGRRQTVIGLNWHKARFTPSSAKKRAATGKGWNRNIWYAIQLLRHLRFPSRPGGFTLNLVGHSRGSMTVIMMLNDLFRAVGPGSFEMTKPTGFGGVERTRVKSFDEYCERLRQMWENRDLSEKAAQDGVADLRWIRGQVRPGVDAEINAWLFDPVGGETEGGSERHMKCPYHEVIRRIRVLRMENEGPLLSGNTPSFDVGRAHGARLLNGTLAMDLLEVEDRERFVIPLCGSHGSGLSENRKGDSPTSADECYVGTGLMLGFLSKCGTRLRSAHMKDRLDPARMLASYKKLMDKFGREGPSSPRSWVNPDHGKSGYKSCYVNAYHRFLDAPKVWKKAAPARKSDKEVLLEFELAARPQ